jgi:aquaporin Z
MKYAAELFGTFVLVMGGVGAAVLGGSQIGNVGVALAFGLSLLAMVYTIGPISGCHVNPAVTFGALLSGRIRLKQAVGYMLAQIMGAIVAAAIVLFIASGGPNGYNAGAGGLAANGYGVHSPGHYCLLAAFAAEIVLSTIFVITVLGATDEKSPAGFAGLAIGLMLTLVHLVGIQVTNTSVNPARSIGPALLVGGWALHQIWLFIVTPLIGGAIAAAIYRGLKRSGGVITTQQAEEALRSQQVERRKQSRPAA